MWNIHGLASAIRSKGKRKAMIDSYRWNSRRKKVDCRVGLQQLLVSSPKDKCHQKVQYSTLVHYPMWKIHGLASAIRSKGKRKAMIDSYRWNSRRKKVDCRVGLQQLLVSSPKDKSPQKVEYSTWVHYPMDPYASNPSFIAYNRSKQRKRVWVHENRLKQEQHCRRSFRSSQHHVTSVSFHVTCGR
jgi:hypothetical protein